jgi:arsenite methyltransferase
MRDMVFDPLMLEFDEQTARQIESVYTTPDVVEQRIATRRALAVRPGERVLDVGSGPGFLAAEIAEDAGGEGGVHGVDPSESMLALARRRTAGAGAAPLEFVTGGATELPFADASFDAVVSTQVLEYVEDVASALAEARRVLRPGGRLLVLDTDWDAIVWHSNEPERMRRVLAAWTEHLADPHLPRRLPRLFRDSGLSLVDCAVLPILNHPYDTDTYSAGLIAIVAGFVPGRGGVNDAEAAAWRDELQGLGEDYFFSLNRYLFVARK